MKQNVDKYKSKKIKWLIRRLNNLISRDFNTMEKDAVRLMPKKSILNIKMTGDNQVNWKFKNF